jgi:aerobic carbon-monoxide dehydrogenase medium subunit
LEILMQSSGLKGRGMNETVSTFEREPVFTYERPSSIAGALTLLSVPGSIVLAGGQSLVPLLARRAIRPTQVVDITGIAELKRIEWHGDDLRIGAAACLSELARSAALASFPLLGEAVRSTANPPVRNRATLIGNLVRAHGSSELTVASVALDAKVVIGSISTNRIVPLADFLLGHHSSAVEAGELVLRLELPRSKASLVGAAFSEIAARSGAPPLVCVAVRLEADNAGTITTARIVAGGIGGKPLRCSATEAAIVGKKVSEAEAAVAIETFVPTSELPDADYALEVLPIVMRRAVLRAVTALQPISSSRE